MPNSVLYLVSFILAGVGAWVVARFAYRWGMVDIPSDRSSHTQPIPKGGGIGILAAFVLSSLLLNIPSGFWLPVTVLALISFYGDRFELSLRCRLPVQLGAALVFLSTGLFCDYHPALFLSIFPLSPLHSILWMLFLTVFIVGTANFFNFMDGINGIAAITGIVGFGLLALYSFLSDRDSLFVVLSICISLSCLGFLPFNMPKAKVFMGDAGSILLGFVFAGMVVWLSKSLLDFVCLAAFLFPFYADELSTMAVRIRNGENLMRPHRKHLYQLLANEKRISHWKISVGYGVLQAVVGIGALVLRGYGTLTIIFFLGVCFAGFGGFGYWLRKRSELATDAH